MRSVLCAIGLVLVLATTTRGEDFKPLFNGRDLTGWRGDAELWSVKDGAIVGNTHGKKITKNTFLIHETPRKNFSLKFKFKLTNGNSGVQFRSEESDGFVVRGYQADIAEERYMGILYEEGKRGILKDVADPDEVTKRVKQGQWNDYAITADGGHITQTINGFTTVDFTETSAEAAQTGILALQLHVGPPMQVEFKDLHIKDLP